MYAHLVSGVGQGFPVGPVGDYSPAVPADAFPGPVHILVFGVLLFVLALQAGAGFRQAPEYLPALGAVPSWSSCSASRTYCLRPPVSLESWFSPLFGPGRLLRHHNLLRAGRPLPTAGPPPRLEPFVGLLWELQFGNGLCSDSFSPMQVLKLCRSRSKPVDSFAEETENDR